MIPLARESAISLISVPRVGGGDPGAVIVKIEIDLCSPRRRG